MLPASFLFFPSDISSNFSNFFFVSVDDDDDIPPCSGGPRSHSLQISKIVPGAACRGVSFLGAPAGAGGDGCGRGLGCPQPGGDGVGGALCHASPPVSTNFLSTGCGGGGGGPPGGGLVQADDEAPPLLEGPGGPSIKPSSSIPLPGPALVLRVVTVGRLGGVAAPSASLLLLELLGDPGNPPLPNSFPVLYWEIRLRLAGLKWVLSPNLSISKCSFFRPPSPGLPWFWMSRMVSNLAIISLTLPRPPYHCSGCF